ncbi:hypothetical protein CIB48_g1704 [Xylaria polymorpha]|nr:hypothetical protein CIB48_g1704 [Xylaria polymorpha]
MEMARFCLDSMAASQVTRFLPTGRDSKKLVEEVGTVEEEAEEARGDWVADDLRMTWSGTVVGAPTRTETSSTFLKQLMLDKQLRYLLRTYLYSHQQLQPAQVPTLNANTLLTGPTPGTDDLSRVRPIIDVPLQFTSIYVYSYSLIKLGMMRNVPT